MSGGANPCFPKPHAVKERRRDSARNGDDPEWVPFAARKAVKKKYTARPTRPAGTGSEHGTGTMRSFAPEVMGRTQPGEICIPTPLISRAVDIQQQCAGSQGTAAQQDSSQPGIEREWPEMDGSHSNARGKGGRPTNTKAHMEDLKRKMTPELWKQVNGLYDSISNLLHATEPATSPRIPYKRFPAARHGARSLFAMCLRQVPAYISLEESWQEDEDEEDKADVSSEVYDDLESLGVSGAGGWKHLREVVRAHGIALLTGAISDGILTTDAIWSFVTLCMHRLAFNEAERILGAYVQMQGRLAMPESTRSELFSTGEKPESQGCLTSVYLFAEKTRRWGFLYRQMEILLASNRLPLEWMATKDVLPLWARIIGSISDQDHHSPDAVRLLEATVLLGCGARLSSASTVAEEDFPQGKKAIASRAEGKEALDNTFSSLSTILSSIVLVSQSQTELPNSSSTRFIAWILESLALSLEVSIQSGASSLTSRATIFLSSALLCHLSGIAFEFDILRPTLETRIHILDSLNSVVSRSKVEDSPMELLPGHIVSISRCCGRAWQDSGFDALQRIINSLTSASSQFRLTSYSAWFMKRLALDSALEFASTTKQGEHFAFARTIEQLVQQHGQFRPLETRFKNPAATPARTTGFRWEEGISEWVMCTPYYAQKGRPKERKPLPPPTPIQSRAETEDSATDEDGEGDDEATPLRKQDLIYDAGSAHLTPCKIQPSPSTKSSTPEWGPRKALGRRESPMVVIHVPSRKRSLEPDLEPRPAGLPYADGTLPLALRRAKRARTISTPARTRLLSMHTTQTRREQSAHSNRTASDGLRSRLTAGPSGRLRMSFPPSSKSRPGTTRDYDDLARPARSGGSTRPARTATMSPPSPRRSSRNSSKKCASRNVPWAHTRAGEFVNNQENDLSIIDAPLIDSCLPKVNCWRRIAVGVFVGGRPEEERVPLKALNVKSMQRVSKTRSLKNNPSLWGKRRRSTRLRHVDSEDELGF